MSSGDLERGIPGDSHRRNHPTIESSSSITDRQPSMLVGYLARGGQPGRDNPPYDITNHHFRYSQPMMQQPNNNGNLQQQQQQQQPQRPQPSPHQPPQRGGVGNYSEASSATGPPSSSFAAASTASSASSHAITQQTPRITLPPLSAITENQDSQQPSEGSGPGKIAPNTPATPGPPSYGSQRSQQSQPPAAAQHPSQPPHPQSSHQSSQSQQQQHPQHTSSQQPPPPSSYPPRPSPQYDSQQQYQRHLHPSPQVPPEQPRYPPGQVAQQMGAQPHQMSQQMPPNPQLGQFPSPVPTPTHFPPQSQYPYPQSPYPPQPVYGGYGHQAPYMPPGIPHQPAYATSHRQRPPPQYNPYPAPGSFAPPPPPQGAPQGWPPQQDYIAQPLTPLTAHSPQQPYSPQVQQPGSGSGGPLRIRRTSSGLSQSPYPSQGEPSQPPAPSQQQVKPKRKRATSGQLRVLNNVFASTFFPSTELRIALGKELGMSPRTVQIWFQNKRQAWRANKAKTEHASTQQLVPKPTTPSSSQPYSGSGAYSPHHLRPEHYGASPGHARISSATDDLREEGMENDEGGGWEALRIAQQENRGNYHQPMGEHEDDIGYDDDLANQPPQRRHR